MVELFKRSSYEDKSILSAQLHQLECLQGVPIERRDVGWTARRDFAWAAAQDTLNRVLPDGSKLKATFESAMLASGEAAPLADPKVINPAALALADAALQSINWEEVAPTGPPLPMWSQYDEIRRWLPELVYRHPWFKVILAAIGTLFILLVTGTFKFYSITFELKNTIEAQSKTLLASVEDQKKKIEKDMADQNAQSAILNSQLDGLAKQTSATSIRLGQLQAEADQKISEITVAATRQIASEVKSKLPTLDDKLDEAQSKAVAAVLSAGKVRADDVLKNLDPGQGFRDKIKEFDDRMGKVNASVSEMNAKQAAAVTRLGALEQRQAVLEKMTHMSNVDGGKIQNLMAVYFGTAVKTVWILASVLAFSCFIHLAYFARWILRKIKT